MSRLCRYAAFLLAATTLGGCAVVYESQQASARKQCEALPNVEEWKACIARNRTTYEQYEKQREGTRPVPAEPAADKPKVPANCYRRASTGELVCANQ